GGPVEAGKGLVVHDGDGVWEDTLSLSDELSITASRDILNDIIANKGPDNFLLALGCASWEPQQLEDEVMDNVWLTCPASNQIIFDLPYKQRWDAAARSMGVDLNRMSYHIGHA
ncbi:MAG: YqgE/AlgH family protein, partial [Cocleimonas sp.]|nr:YqgE/AlgH family protein [Cocleimonas sp.]